MKRMKRMSQKQTKPALKCKWYHPILLTAALIILPAGAFLAGAGGSAWVSARSNENQQMETGQEIEKKSCIYQIWNGQGDGNKNPAAEGTTPGSGNPTADCNKPNAGETSSGEQMQETPTGGGSIAGNQDASGNGNSQNSQSDGSAQKHDCTESEQSQSSGAQKDDTGAGSTDTSGTEKPDKGDKDTAGTGTEESGTGETGSTGSGIAESGAAGTGTTGSGNEESGSAGTGTAGSETGKTDPAETEKENTSSEEVTVPSCVCTEQCSQADREIACGICRTNPEKCIGKRISVRISILPPEGWHNRTAKVEIKVQDLKQNGTFQIAKVQAKIGQNGTWQDITDRMTVMISENCTIYVQVTDQRDRLYEKNAVIQCFDRTRPTLNGAINGGLLSVVGYDTESGIQAIYVNGYEFTNLTNGTLNIRLQKFDAGYQYFTMQTMDKAGNMSEVYKMTNPYYTDPSKKDSTTKDPAAQLPANGSPTRPGSATGTVTEHIKTDTQGNQLIPNQTGTAGTSIGQSSGGTTGSTNSNIGQTGNAAIGDTGTSTGAAAIDPETGREFYTIQTASDKTFYLVIDRDHSNESVYFLTEISENDLLNTLEKTSELLPMNSAVAESAIPGGVETLPDADSTDSALSDAAGSSTGQSEQESGAENESETVISPAEGESGSGDRKLPSWMLIGGIALLTGAAAVYFRLIRKKNNTFLDDEEEEEALSDYEYETEEDELESDFFRADESDEDADSTETDHGYTYSEAEEQDETGGYSYPADDDDGDSGESPADPDDLKEESYTETAYSAESESDSGTSDSDDDDF